MPRLNSTAVHEAGHAVITIEEGRTFSHVAIEDRGNTRGAVHNTLVFRGDDEDVRIKLAGVMAQRMCWRRWHPRLFWGAEGDLIGVGAFFREQEPLRVLIDWNIDATYRSLLTHWSAVDAVARLLFRRRTLTYAEVHEVWTSTSSGGVPPGVLSDDMWKPLRERIDWHIENPGGIEGLIERAERGASSQAATVE